MGCTQVAQATAVETAAMKYSRATQRLAPACSADRPRHPIPAHQGSPGNAAAQPPASPPPSSAPAYSAAWPESSLAMLQQQPRHECLAGGHLVRATSMSYHKQTIKEGRVAERKGRVKTRVRLSRYVKWTMEPGPHNMKGGGLIN